MKIILYILLAFIALVFLIQYAKHRRVRRLTDPKRDHLRK